MAFIMNGMKPSLPLLRYPSEPEPVRLPAAPEPPLPLDYRVLQAGLGFGAAASALFVLSQLAYASLITGLELHGQGLFLLPRFLEQVLGGGYWSTPWIIFHVLILGLQLWSLLQLRRAVRGQPPADNANRATFFWVALICLLGVAGLLLLFDAEGLAVLATLLAAVCGYAAIICQARIYRSIARHLEYAPVARLAAWLSVGLLSVPLLGFLSFGSAFFSFMATILRSIGNWGRSSARMNPQAAQDAEVLHLILVVVVLATVLLHFLMTVVFYLQLRARKEPALPMATEVLPNPLE